MVNSSIIIVTRTTTVPANSDIEFEAGIQSIPKNLGVFQPTMPSRKKTPKRPPTKATPAPTRSTSRSASTSTSRATSQSTSPSRRSGRVRKTVTWEDELPSRSPPRTPPKTLRPPNTKRLPPPNPIRKLWGPSTVRARVVERTADRKAEKAARQARSRAEASRQQSNPIDSVSEAIELEEEEQEEQELPEQASSDRFTPQESDDDEDFDTIRERQEESNYQAWQKERCPFTLRLTCKARVNANRNSIKWTTPMLNPKGGEWHTQDPHFSISEIALQLDKAMEQNGFDSLGVKYIVVIKSDHSQSKRERIHLSNLNDNTWDQVDRMLQEEWRRYPGYISRVEIESYGVITPILSTAITTSMTQPTQLKRSILNITSPAASLRRRRTRTVQLEEQAAQRRDTNEEAGNWMEELVERWHCNNDKCINHDNTCFITWDH